MAGYGQNAGAKQEQAIALLLGRCRNSTQVSYQAEAESGKSRDSGLLGQVDGMAVGRPQRVFDATFVFSDVDVSLH